MKKIFILLALTAVVLFCTACPGSNGSDLPGYGTYNRAGYSSENITVTKNSYKRIYKDSLGKEQTESSAYSFEKGVLTTTQLDSNKVYSFYEDNAVLVQKTGFNFCADAMTARSGLVSATLKYSVKKSTEVPCTLTLKTDGTFLLEYSTGAFANDTGAYTLKSGVLLLGGGDKGLLYVSPQSTVYFDFIYIKDGNLDIFK